MVQRRVVVTGLGVVSPVGNNLKDFWSNLCQGKSGISRISKFDPSEFNSQIAGEVRDFVPSPHISAKEIRRMERFVQFAVTAAYAALEDSRLDLGKEDPFRIGVLIGSGIGSLEAIQREYKIFLEKGPGRISPFLIPSLIVNMAAGQVSISLKVKGPNSCVATACASGNNALGDAFKIIQRGDAEVMFAGGTESCIVETGLGGFCSLKALSSRNDAPERASRPFDKLRDGFVMGEGTGIAVLEEIEHARKRNASIYAEVIGYGMSGDAYHITAPDPSAEGAAMSMHNALKDSGVKPQEVSYINAHGTSTVLNDKVETIAIKKVFGDYAKKVAINSTKSMVGHLLGAAGGVEFLVCALSIKNDLLHPTINQEVPDPECNLDYVPNQARKMKVEVAMSNSLGFGGHNATLVLRKLR
jgi:3-oxoacyl-[acyl-carrier-protein] synthase II